MPTTRQGMSSATIEQLIAQRVADAIATYEVNQNNRNGTQNEASGSTVKYVTCTLLDGALTWWNSYVKTIELDAAYETTWEELKKMMTEEYCSRNKLQNMGRHSGKGDCFKADQDSGSNPHGTRFDRSSCKSQGRKGC
ncbi:hypothetical protein Tco_1434796 [Tanacetum coccineum]